jgi:asparagine synthase (glutamine-hydrolysing)
MRRLSIIDVVGGRQPIFSEHRNAVVVYNGETYNFRELRRDLEGKGHHFATRTDTEVIVHLYEEHGDRCVEKMNGMFAFALWDKDRQRLLLARDRLGVKPLFYFVDAHRLIFASEVKAILAEGSVPREVDPVGLHHFLSLNYVPRQFTLFRNIRKLLPGHILTVEAGRVSVSQYWRLPEPEVAVNEDRLAEELVERLLESVRLRLVSDVPLGVFLSGGIDSSLVTALATKANKGPVSTFSIGFQEESFSELPYARLTARRYNADHHEMIVKCEVEDLLPKLTWHSDEPSADSSAVPTYFLSKFAREHVKVILSGDGGDELFGGYETYAAYNAARLYRRLPGALRAAIRSVAHRLPVSEKKVSFDYRAKRFADGAEMEPLRAHFWWNGTFNEEQKRWLYSQEFAHQVGDLDTLQVFRECLCANSEADFPAALMHADTKTYLVDDILVKVDRMSMANSLEVRTPFLDYTFVEFAARLPSRLKVRGLRKKLLLKRAAEGLVPHQNIYRKKQGFSIPVALWLKTRLRPIVEDLLSEERVRSQGLFRPEAVRELVRQHMAAEANHGFSLWGLMVISLWHGLFISRRLSRP